jgi:hypothetical protein
MSTLMVPANAGEALKMLEAALGFLADADVTEMPTAVQAECLAGLERADAMEAAARGRLLAAFDAQDGSLSYGQRTTRAWLVHCLRVTKGQAREYLALEALARKHQPLHAGMRGQAVTKSVALQLARWIRVIPEEFREEAEEILIAAAQAGADLPALAAICAEIQERTAPPDPDDPVDDPRLDRAVYFDTTFDGAGVLRGDLTPECAAMVGAVLDALATSEGRGDLRTESQRYHDALAEAMRRLLASDLLPKRAGQPTKALVHIHFAELLAMDKDSALQDAWIREYRARWAAHRASASVRPGDGGAWLTGDAARAVACDAMIIPVVTGDLDPEAIEDLIGLCVQYDRARAHVPQPEQAQSSADPQSQSQSLELLEHQILARVIQVVSGSGGIASFLRRNMLGKGLAGPSLPLDVGQTDEIPVHLRRLVALRDQGCQYAGGYFL